MSDADAMERGFLKDEMLDCAVYSRLAKSESNGEVRDLLSALAKTERSHVEMWKTLLGVGSSYDIKPAFMELRILEMLVVRRFLGVAFVVKFLERHERHDLKKYTKTFSGPLMGKKYRKSASKMINDFAKHERTLRKKADNYKGELEHVQSIILGLNDGLVEILAIIAGLAIVATSSFTVVVIGLIAGVSGALSMTGGVYLSSKSYGLVRSNRIKEKSSPVREGYNAGIWYLIGSVLAILPFIFGFVGVRALAISVVLVCAALTGVSGIVAVISETSFRKRALEMIAISLGAVFVMMILGVLAKMYFGVSV